jgi:hypothetical protein
MSAMTTTGDDPHMSIFTILCSDEYGGDGSSGTPAHATGSAENTWDCSTHGYALGRCEQASSHDVTNTGLHPSCHRA